MTYSTNGDSRPYTERLVIDRLPPQNLEAEQGALGSILLNNAVIHDVVSVLRWEDFYREAHQIVYRAIVDLHQAGSKIDAIILADELTRRDQYKAIGGDDFLAEIIHSVPHEVNARYYSDIVRQKSVSRQLIEAANETLREGYSNSFTAEQLLSKAVERDLAIADASAEAKTMQVADVVVTAMDSIARRTQGEVKGIPSGLPDLDDFTLGWKPSDMVVIAARPSTGKTALSLQCADYAATEWKSRVFFASLEMSAEALVERLLVLRSRVDGRNVQTGKFLGTKQMAELGKAYDDLRGSRTGIHDSPMQTMLQIGAAARRHKLKSGGLDLVVIDYLQLIDWEDSRGSENIELGKISKGVKALARQLDVPVLILSQLNRLSEGREGHRPRMSDLRGSGSIEQDADMVLLMHCPEKYDPNDKPGIIEINIAKNRNGPTGGIELAFIKSQMRFESIAKTQDFGPPPQTF